MAALFVFVAWFRGNGGRGAECKGGWVDHREEGTIHLSGEWKTKAEESTFFPDSWSKQTVQEEIAFAYKNKKPLGGNKFEGIMSDGTKLIMFIDGDKITSAFPEI